MVNLLIYISAISPDQMTTILQNRGLNTIPRHLQTRAASLIASHQQITPFITTQPATIQQPTLQPPTPSQVIVDSIGNQGVITNQNFGSQSGGGVAVWYSTQKDNHAAGNHVLSVPHLNSLSNPVVQPSGDLSGVGMAAPTGILPVTLPGSGASSISTTSNPFLQHVTDQPIDFMFTTPSPFPNNLGKVISSLVDVALESMIHLLTPSIRIDPVVQNTTINSTANTSNVVDHANVTQATPTTVSSVAINVTNGFSSSTTFTKKTIIPIITEPMTKSQTTTLPSTTVGITTTTEVPTTTTTTQRTTTLSEDVIRLPDGRIITHAMLESMDPEQAEFYAEMSERQA